MKPVVLSTLLAMGCTLAAAQPVQFATPEAAIKYRQGAFSVMGAHFSRVAMMAQGIQPFDAKVAQENTALIYSLSKLPFNAFGPGTDKGAPTRAKDEIWKDGAKFKGAADRMVAEVGKLDAAAKIGDYEALKNAADGVGKACKGCHDDFRGARRGGTE